MSLSTIHKNKSKLLLRCQSPPPGSFDISGLEWASSSNEAETETPLLDAIISYDRVDDYLAGEKAREACLMSISKTKTNDHLNLKCAFW